jgi:hypothetical protein
MAAGAACIASAAVPTVAAAQTVELGLTHSPVVAPSCPSTIAPTDCKIVLTRSTALETIRDGTNYPTTATKSGEIVAFTVGLSGLSTNTKTAHSEIQGLDHAYGGTTQAAVAVLKPIGAHKSWQWQLQAVSPVVHLQPYLGTITQFPLATPLPIAAGEAVGLSVPTWAPVLSIGLTATAFAYRQSRKSNCGSPAGVDEAMFTLQVTDVFGCDYTGTRVEYSATEITTHQPAKLQVHQKRLPAKRINQPRVLARIQYPPPDRLEDGCAWRSVGCRRRDETRAAAGGRGGESAGSGR